MLRFNHLIFFGPTGTAQWKGNIYGAPRFTWLINQPVVYHGVFGHGLFQSIYPTPRSAIADYVSSVEWFALTLFIFALAIPLEKLRIVPFLMFGATFLVALSYMIHARLEARFDTIPARILVMLLAFTQPLVRGWARYYTWLKFKRTPQSVIMAPHAHERSPQRRLAMTRRRYWNEAGVGREALLTEIVAALETEGWRYSTDTGWKAWDIQIYGNLWWNLRLRTVTEYHGGPEVPDPGGSHVLSGRDDRAVEPDRRAGPGLSANFNRDPVARLLDPGGLCRGSVVYLLSRLPAQVARLGSGGDCGTQNRVGTGDRAAPGKRPTGGRSIRGAQPGRGR